MKRLILIFLSAVALTASHPWEGKRIAYLGDSITDPKVLPEDTHYWAYLQEWLGAETYVYGVSGHQWTHLPGQADRLWKEHGDNVDAIVIFLGTNDYNTGIPIGEWYTETIEKANANGKEVERRRRNLVYDQSTFRGRINFALDSLKRMYPTKQIVLMTPLHRGPAQFSEKNVQPSEEFCNSCGEYLDAYGLTAEDDWQQQAKNDLMQELFRNKLAQLKAACNFRANYHAVKIVPPVGLYEDK